MTVPTKVGFLSEVSNLDQLITAGQLNLAGGSIETSLDASGLKIGDHYTVVRTLNGNGALEFIDNDAQQLPMRFYRFVLP